MKTDQYVIIGNGVAAAGCIEGIRSVDRTGSITVISKEKHPVYCRPLISYYLEKKTDLDKMNYRDADFYEKNNCEVLYGKTAAKIDANEKIVFTNDGISHPYSSVCIAAGSAPFIPAFDGLDSVSRKYTFMTLDDAVELESTVTKESKVLIIGAGLIGLKCAEGLSGIAGCITVCDLSDHVLSSILDRDCALIVQKHLTENKINFLLNDSVVRFDCNRAIMKNDTELEFDILVLALGVRPNTALIGNMGGAVNRGILVNERMETSFADIYAAGDCTEGYDVSLGERSVLALLPNAYMQGYASGVNMAGGDTVFDKAIPMNSIGFFGLHIMSAGRSSGEMYEEKNENTIKRFYVKDGLLKGFIIVGNTERAGIYTDLIRERTPLETINFELLKKNATTTIFSPNARRKKFGGVV